MLNVKWIIKNKKLYEEACSKRGIDGNFTEIEKLHQCITEKTTELNLLQEKRNEISSKISKLIKEKKSFDELKNESATVATDIAAIKNSLEIEKNNLKNILDYIPNILSPHVPFGSSDKDNQVFFCNKEKYENSNALPHYEISNMIDFNRGVKISGPRSTIVRGKFSVLYRAIQSFLLNENIKAGYVDHILPVIVKTEAMYGSDKFPKFSDDAFNVGDKWLIPTSEVPLITQYSNEIINVDNPIRMTSATSCFRKEVGSAGKDVAGLLRQHQFDKVELVVICDEKDAHNEYVYMTDHVSNLLSLLNLEYRKVLLCSGDTGFGATKTIDFEVYFEGMKEFREVSSCSICNDFQSRRSKIRYKTQQGTKFPFTMNGSGLPIGRIFAAILENNQNGETISVPEVLKDYTKFDMIEL